VAGDLMPLPLFATARTTHHEAIDWATRASANGGTISTTVIRGVSAFCADIDRQGLRDRFARLSIFSGGNLSGALVPLYRSFSYGGTLIGSATDTNVNFVSGDFAESGASAGLTGNGTTKHLNCGASILSQLSVGNAHLSVSGASLAGGGGQNLMGAGGSGFNSLAALQRGSLSTHKAFVNGTPTAEVNTTAGFSAGQLIASSVATNDLRMFQNGTQNGSTVTTTRSGSLTANSVFVFAYNDNGTAATRVAARLQSYSIGLGLNATQAAAFSAAVAALNTALGR
jgi:hypothetical protein